MNLRTGSLMQSAVAALFLFGCNDDNLCTWITDGCVELTLQGASTTSELDVQLVQSNGQTSHPGVLRNGIAAMLPHKVRFLPPPDSQVPTSRYVRLNVRSHESTPQVTASTVLSWPDDSHVTATVDLRAQVCAGAWCLENPPIAGNPVTSSRLTAVWAGGPVDVWITEDTGTILHFDGKGWQKSTPESGTPLYGIFGVAPSAIWAVGGNGAVFYYDGQAWTKQSTGTTSALTGVWASGVSDVWAVGVAGTLLHNNGSAWSAAPESGQATSEALRAVSGRSMADVWAVGDVETLLHYNGAAWSAATFSGTKTTRKFQAIWLSPDGSGWIVGEGNKFLQLSGGQWSSLAPGIATTISGGVWGTRRDDVWAVGCEMQIAHFNGVSWSLVPRVEAFRPSQSDGSCSSYYFTGASGSGPLDAWAVGATGQIAKFGYWLE